MPEQQPSPPQQVTIATQQTTPVTGDASGSRSMTGRTWATQRTSFRRLLSVQGLECFLWENNRHDKGNLETRRPQSPFVSGILQIAAQKEKQKWNRPIKIKQEEARRLKLVVPDPQPKRLPEAEDLECEWLSVQMKWDGRLCQLVNAFVTERVWMWEVHSLGKP